ncbi:hypothetical protein ACJX0J_026593, partial [Zea mays]
QSDPPKILECRIRSMVHHLFRTMGDPVEKTIFVKPHKLILQFQEIDVRHNDSTCCDKQGYFTLDEWRTGLKALRADSISKLKKAFPELVQECNFADHFHMFINPGYKVIQFLGFLHICISLLPHRYEDKKKCIEIPVACELLNLVLGLQFRPQVDKLNNYLMYQNDYKVITMDQWMGFIRFCNE